MRETVKSLSFFVFGILALTGSGAYALEGMVQTTSGVPVEQARVQVFGVEDDVLQATVYTGPDGRFQADVAPPALVVVQHARFETLAVPVEADDAGVLTLQPKQTVYEEISVTATRGGDAFQPASITSTVVEPEEAVQPPATLLEVVDEVPGVAENGQAGIFQVFSIRGISRQRILTLISGMQVTSERRAGVSASFVDPLLMGSVDLLRGPASSYYGSGALGGVVQVFPETYPAWTYRGGYEVPADETYHRLGWGSVERGWSVGLAHRRAENTEAADGTEINSHFEQTSATLRKSWADGQGVDFELLAIPTVGRDLGKANTEFPERTTNYPEENHLLVKLTATSGPGSWRAYGYAHPHDLETETVRLDGRRDNVFNETFDFGGNFQLEDVLGEIGTVRFGVDWFGRRGVDAVEEERRPGAELVRLQTLDGALQDEGAAYGSLRHHFGRATLEAGGRFTWIRQQNDDGPTFDDSAWTGFAGAVIPLGGGFELSANVGTGFRFPNLSERFFTGTTGRGEIVGNPNLDAEQSFNTDLRLAWFGRRLFLETDVFRNEIDDYVERIELSEDVLTFVNLTSGTLEGFEFEGFFEMRPGRRLSWGGHTIEGEDDTGRPLADVPPDRIFLALRKSPGRDDPWSWGTRLERRADKQDAGSGEAPIPSATLLSATVGYELRPGLTLSLSGGNLLDEEYVSSADEQAPPAEGRSVGIAVEWRP